MNESPRRSGAANSREEYYPKDTRNGRFFRHLINYSLKLLKVKER